MADTIAAIATAPGRGGIGVIRVSGRDLRDFACDLTGHSIVKPRHAGFVRFRDAEGHAIDEGLLIYFPAPASFTGEDVVELQGHGGPVVLSLLLQRCVELGARPAEPGEFSRRAFLNGRMDLAQAEAVADLIDASTSAAARSAVRSLSGEFSRRVTAMQGELIDLRMLVEATLDFPEEEIDFLQQARAYERLDSVIERLDDVLASARQGSLLRDGLQVVLVGRPNVGKSSVLNALSGSDRAIVTEVAGTTRDTIRESIQLEGIPLHIIDTAGLRETDDPVERIGVQRTREEIRNADVIVRLVAADEPSDQIKEDEVSEHVDPDRWVPRLLVRNKIDLVDGRAERAVKAGGVEIALSAKTGQGMDFLRQELLRIAGWVPHEEDVPLARERHLAALHSTKEHLASARNNGFAFDLFAEDLRLAQESLGQITGEFTADDLLGEIFTRFCIGK